MEHIESVFCLKRKHIEEHLKRGMPQGSFTLSSLESMLSLPQFFMPRTEVEHNPDYKQVIPYQIFRKKDRFLVYQRGGQVNEGRLAGRFSLGVGGHINIEDATSGTLCPADYHAALMRERLEEMGCAANMKTSFIGWINDDSDLVGQVHLGAVHLCEVDFCDEVGIQPNHEGIEEVGWWLEDKIHDEKDSFEKWSILAINLPKNAQEVF